MKKELQHSMYDWAIGYLLNKYGETNYILAIAPSRWDWAQSLAEFYDLMEDAINKMRWRTKR